MKTSNSKTLYRFARSQRSKQNMPSGPEDSFDLPSPPPTHPKLTHLRSQSCPFDGPPPLLPKARPPSECSWQTTCKAPRVVESQHSVSQISMGNGTVIIRECGLEQLSGALWRGGRKGGVVKHGMGWKGAFARTQISQQIRSYELRQQLRVVEKESEQVALKQRVLESLISRCQPVLCRGEARLENSFEFA